MVFQERVKVGNFDCDSTGRIRISAAVRAMQQVSQNQLDHLGMTYQLLWEEGQTFLLSKTMLQVEQLPAAGDEVVISTVPVETKGARFLRDFLMEDREGNLLIAAATHWILVDPKSRRILRPRGFQHTLPFGESVSQPYVVERGFPRTDTDEPDATVDYPVVYSHIDTNGHVNNSFYIDFACNLLPAGSLESGVVSFVEIEYQNEAVLGDIVTISRYPMGERTWRFVGKVGETPCFRALIGLK